MSESRIPSQHEGKKVEGTGRNPNYTLRRAGAIGCVLLAGAGIIGITRTAFDTTPVSKVAYPFRITTTPNTTSGVNDSIDELISSPGTGGEAKEILKKVHRDDLVRLVSEAIQNAACEGERTQTGYKLVITVDENGKVRAVNFEDSPIEVGQITQCNQSIS